MHHRTPCPLPFLVLLLLALLAPTAHADDMVYSDTADPFPEDAALALSATVSQMRGWPLTGLPVSLMPGGRFQFAERQFRYQDFGVRDVELLDLHFIENNPLHRYMQAVLHFEDESGRVALAQIAVQYALYENQGIMLRNAAAWPLFAPRPRFELFAVPAVLFKEWGQQAMHSHAALHAFAQANAATSGSGEFVLLLFARDRLKPGSSLGVVLSGDPEELDQDDSLADFSYLDFDGWTVALAQGPATLGDTRSLLYLNVLYAAPGAKPKPCGRFDTMLLPAPPEAAPFAAGQTQQAQQSGQQQFGQQQFGQQIRQPAASAPSAAPSPPGEGPVGGGRMLLNPIFPDHVKLIQLRLQALGYYKGPIDMQFNTRTKEALGDFATWQNLPRDQWSLKLQKALFQGSGQ